MIDYMDCYGEKANELKVAAAINLEYYIDHPDMVGDYKAELFPNMMTNWDHVYLMCDKLDIEDIEAHLNYFEIYQVQIIDHTKLKYVDFKKVIEKVEFGSILHYELIMKTHYNVLTLFNYDQESQKVAT